MGGASYLAQLTQKVGSAANVEFHAKIIAQKYVQREPDPLGDGDPETLVRRVDRRDGA